MNEEMGLEARMSREGKREEGGSVRGRRVQ